MKQMNQLLNVPVLLVALIAGAVIGYQALAALYFDPSGQLMRGAFPVYSWSETTEDNSELNRGAHVSCASKVIENRH